MFALEKKEIFEQLRGLGLSPAVVSRRTDVHSALLHPVPISSLLCNHQSDPIFANFALSSLAPVRGNEMRLGLGWFGESLAYDVLVLIGESQREVTRLVTVYFFCCLPLL